MPRLRLLAIFFPILFVCVLANCSRRPDAWTEQTTRNSHAIRATDAGIFATHLIAPSFRTSWIGEWLTADDATHAATAAIQNPKHWIQAQLSAIWVDPASSERMVYTNSPYDESGREGGIYQYDPSTPLGLEHGTFHPFGFLYPNGIQGGNVITGDDMYIYAYVLNNYTYPIPSYWIFRYKRGQYDANGTLQPASFPGGQGLGDSGQLAALRVDGPVAGLAAGGGRLFISRPDINAIVVYDRNTMTRVASNTVNNPGALAYRASTASVYSLLDAPWGERMAYQWDVLGDSTFAPNTGIRGLANPVALAVTATRLFIADAGVEQVRVFDITQRDANLSFAQVDQIGQSGGVSGNGGAYADDRFDGLSGVGIDSDGALYVASNGLGGNAAGWFDLRRFGPTKDLDAKAFSYPLSAVAVFDPNDPTKVYTATHAYTLDYTKNASTGSAPGQEWSPSRTDLTIDRRGCPTDIRNDPASANEVETPLAIRNLAGVDGVVRKYLYVKSFGPGPRFGVYRFDGSFAHPSLLISDGTLPGSNRPTNHPNGAWRWIDTNGNCQYDAEEFIQAASVVPESIDEQGDLWSTVQVNNWITHVRLNHFDTNNNPVFDFDAPENLFIDVSHQTLRSIHQVQYVSAGDTLYLYGRSIADTDSLPIWLLARYDQIHANPIRRWIVDMGYQSCPVCWPNSMSISDNRVYVMDINSGAADPGTFATAGRIRTFDAATGVYAGDLQPGPEVAYTSAWGDNNYASVFAARLSTGEHVVFAEEEFASRILMYRYVPFDPATVPGLSLWLRSDLGITLNGTNVSAWADQSGLGHDYAAFGAGVPYAARDPRFNNLPSVGGPGNLDALQGPTPGAIVGSNAAGAEWFMVMQADNTSNVSFGVGFGTQFLGYAQYFGFNGWIYDDFFGKQTSSDEVRFAWPAGAALYSPMIYNARSAASGWNANINGAIVFTSTQNEFTVGPESTTMFGNATKRNFASVAEEIIYNRVLAGDERDRVSSYLAAKYGITLQ